MSRRKSREKAFSHSQTGLTEQNTEAGSFHQDAKSNAFVKYLFFFLVCLASLSFLYSIGASDVLRYYMPWIENVHQYGIVKGYHANELDYPPLCMVIFSAVCKASHAMSSDHMLGFKVSLYVFLLFTSLVVFVWTRDILFTSVVQLALTVNSMGLGYVDIYLAPVLLLSLLALKQRRLIVFSILFTIAIMIKWQPLIIAPFVFLYIIEIEKLNDIKHIRKKPLLLHCILPAVLVTVFLFGIFGREIYDSFVSALSHKFLSGLALNFNWILTYFLHLFCPGKFGPVAESFSFGMLIETRDIWITLLPKLIFMACYLLSFAVFFRQKKTFRNFLIFSIIGYMAYFTFNTGAHENHLYVVCILAIMLYWIDRSQLLTAIFIVLFFNVNLIVFYGFYGQAKGTVTGFDITVALSLLWVVFFMVKFIPILRCLKNPGYSEVSDL